jgi:hypothetical protein
MSGGSDSQWDNPGLIQELGTERRAVVRAGATGSNAGSTVVGRFRTNR